MIYTSYFSSKKYNIELGVSIARYANFWKGEICQELFPSKELLADYKADLINESQYKARYVVETLSKLNPKELAAKLNNKVLLCYEKSGDFCHRHIVADWFNQNGIACEEL